MSVCCVMVFVYLAVCSKINSNPKKPVKIYPLPHMYVVKDLVPVSWFLLLSFVMVFSQWQLVQVGGVTVCSHWHLVVVWQCAYTDTWCRWVVWQSSQWYLVPVGWVLWQCAHTDTWCQWVECYDSVLTMMPSGSGFSVVKVSLQWHLVLVGWVLWQCPCNAT